MNKLMTINSSYHRVLTVGHHEGTWNIFSNVILLITRRNQYLYPILQRWKLRLNVMRKLTKEVHGRDRI